MKQKAVRIIYAQSALATVGSLYYGYFGDPVINGVTGDLFNPLNALIPCELCRYARILMYPILLITIVGILQKTANFVRYILPFTVIGIGLETYYYALQKFDISTDFTCTFTNPCNASEVEYFWFVTIPLLAWIAFFIILICCIYLLERTKESTS